MRGAIGRYVGIGIFAVVLAVSSCRDMEGEAGGAGAAAPAFPGAAPPIGGPGVRRAKPQKQWKLRPTSPANIGGANGPRGAKTPMY